MSDILATDCDPSIGDPFKMNKTAKTWSLQAIDTCPGSLDSVGELVPACANCYATKGMYHMPNVKKTRSHNLSDWKHPDWTSTMIERINKQKLDYFRWFDSGDMYHIGLAKKILAVMRATPTKSHWLPTRMHKFAKFKPVLAKMAKLDNVVVRFSSDSITGGRIRGKNTSTIVQNNKQAGNAHLCPATKHGIPKDMQKCISNNCTACWNKDIPVIAYNFH